MRFSTLQVQVTYLFRGFHCANLNVSCMLSHKCNYNFWFTVCCIYFQGFSLYIIPWPGNTKIASRLHVSHAAFFILSKAYLCMTGTFAMSASIKSISAFNKVLFNCYLASNTKRVHISAICIHVYINYEQLNVIKSHCDWSYIPHNLAMIYIESLVFVDHPKVDVCEYQKQEAESYQCYLIIPEPVHAGLKPPGLQFLCTIDTTLKTERWKTANNIYQWQ